MIYKGVCVAMIGVFVASCAVQYNDPDPWLWVAAYGLAGIFSGLALAGRLTPLAIPAGLAYFGWAMYNMPHVPASEWLHTETSRESGGLIISAIWMGVLAIAWYRKRHPAPAQN